jgi:hypothetical protein
MKYLQLLQQWECYISEPPDGDQTEIGKLHFGAVIHDLTNPDRPEEYAEIKVAAVEAKDRDMLVAGSYFYWSIVRDEKGHVKSLLTFPRIYWTNEEIETAEQRAKEMMEALGWNETPRQ